MRTLSDRDGVAGIAMLAMFSDGIIRAEEDDLLRDRLHSYSLFADVADSELGAVLSDLERRSREEGADRLLQECCYAVREEMADTAVAIAREIIEADEEVAPEELQFLERLQELLSNG